MELFGVSREALLKNFPNTIVSGSLTGRGKLIHIHIIHEEGGPLGPYPQELHLLLAAGTWKFVSLRSVGMGGFPVPQRVTSVPVHVNNTS